MGGSGGAFTAPTPGSAAAPSAPAAPSASAPPADVAKPTPARPAVAGGVAPLGTQDPAAAAALHAARQFFGFMHQGMAAGGFGVPPGAFGAPPDARQGAPVTQHVDPSEQPPRGATPGVAADGAVTYNRKDKRYARDERRSFVFFPSLARAPPGRHEERLRRARPASPCRMAIA